MSNGDVRNMSLGRRELLSLVASLMALMALGIDILLPAFDDIRVAFGLVEDSSCLLYTSPSPRDQRGSRMPSSA